MPADSNNNKPPILNDVLGETVQVKEYSRDAGSLWGMWKIAFILILFAGFGVRLIYITSESVWWDEFATVAFLKAPQSYMDSPDYSRWNSQVIRSDPETLQAFLAQNKLVDPAAMPLYLCVQYYWNTYVSRSVVSLRLLSVAISMLTLCFVFILGRRLFDTRAGLVAMVCFALSPIHVQFAKEIRMYGLMTLLAAALVYIFCNLFEKGGKRWWVLYAVTALLLSWTHPFALLLPFSLGLFWLITMPKGIRRLFAWSMMNGVVLLPAAVYVLTIQFWGEDSTSNWMRVPALSELVADIIADDAIGMTYQVNATTYALDRIVSREIALYILSLRWIIGRLMMVGIFCAILWLIAVVNFRRKNNGSARFPYAHKWTWLLLSWLVAPPVVLYLMSVFWRPCIMPRYTVYSSVALYLLLGGAISMITMRYLRILLVAVLCLFYGYQQALMAGEPQHPDWYGARDYIRCSADPGDLILVHNWLWKRVFVFNMGPSAHIIGYGSTCDILAEQCAFRLHYESGSENEEQPVVWAVIRTEYFEKGPIVAFEKELTLRGLNFDVRAEFGGIQHVLVYRVVGVPVLNPGRKFTGEAPKEFGDLAMEYWRDGKYEDAVAFADYANQIDPEYSRAWSYKGMALKELGRQAEALASFERAIALDRLDYPWSHINIAMLLVDMGRNAEAVNAALRALEVLPDDAWAHAMLGQAHLGLGEYEEALVSLRKAAELNPAEMRIHELLKEAEAAISASRGANE